MAKTITKNRWDKLRQRMIVYGIEDVPLTAIPENLTLVTKDHETAAARLLVLLSVSLCASNSDMTDRIADWLKTADIWQFASENEKYFFRVGDIEESDRARLSFRFEAAYMLAWSLGFVNELPDPAGECDQELVADFFSNIPPLFTDTDEFLSDAAFRRISVLHDEYLFYLMTHLYFRHIEEADKENSSNVHIACAQQRYLVLEWLFDTENTGWDELQQEPEE